MIKLDASPQTRLPTDGGEDEDASARSSWKAATDLARDCGWQEVVVADWKGSREVGEGLDNKDRHQGVIHN